MAEEIGVGVLMFIAYRAAENRIFEAVQRAGYTDFTVAQGRIAARIGPNGTRLGDLAEQAQVAKQTATALVDRLERAGYVERIVDPTDARARLVRMGPLGPAVLSVAREEEARIEAEWTEHLGPRRMKQLRDALTMLREITDPYQEPQAQQTTRRYRVSIRQKWTPHLAGKVRKWRIDTSRTAQR